MRPLVLTDLDLYSFKQDLVTKVRKDVEGYWAGRCTLCGHECGACLGAPPDNWTRYHVVCAGGPRCPGQGKDDTIVWVWIDPK